MTIRPRIPAAVALLGLLLACPARGGASTGPVSALVQDDPGAALWEAGRRAEAIAAWSTRLAANPADTTLRRRLAAAQGEVHWYQQALDTLAPLGSAADASRGPLYYRLGRLEEALPFLDAADATHLWMRLEALEQLGRDGELGGLLDALEARSNGSSEQGAQVALDERVVCARARWLVRAGHLGEAIAHFRRALEADPLDPAALFGLGRALVATDQQEEGLALLERHRALLPKLDALDFAQRGVDLAPLHGPNHASLGDAQRALGLTANARASYERALQLAHGEDCVPIALRAARLLVEDLHDVDAAVATLERAAGESPDARLYVRSGDVLLEAGRGIDAVQRYLKARELRPDDPQIERRIEAARNTYRRDKP